LRVGTRESQLARLQTDLVIAALKEVQPSIQIDVVPISTSGDKILGKPLHQLGGAGVFVKELEEALATEDVDFVVHSLKDVPTDLPDGLILGAVLLREDPRDVFLSRDGKTFTEMASASRIATSSRRRAAQLDGHRNDLVFVDVRGNVPTRLKKLEEGACDGLVLAAAGLLRLGLADKIAEYFEPRFCLPAAGQGALTVECRTDDEDVVSLLAGINDENFQAEAEAERALLRHLGGGCSVPIGALARASGKGKLRLRTCIAGGGTTLFGEKEGLAVDAISLGQSLGEEMLEKGAREILSSLADLAPHTISPP
jgi:hydroxymethylbilane synthase